ncbi:MAG: hypothetical protein ABI575_01860 [Oxalobacteraceae bacterium]
MSALMEASATISNDAESSAIEIKEGDWTSYQQHVARCLSEGDLDVYSGDIIIYKRMCALAYLGRRAQHHGGVCSSVLPRILTAQLIAEMANNNKTQRYVLYPWLEKLMGLLAEIERIQDVISNEQNNVISLVSLGK